MHMLILLGAALMLPAAPTPRSKPAKAERVVVTTYRVVKGQTRLDRKKQRPHVAWLYSVDNANTDYRLTIPLAKRTDRGYALLVGPDVVKSTSNGGDARSWHYTFRLDRAQADRVAAGLGIARKDRPPLGRDVKVTFAAKATRVGQPVTITATLTNTGTKPLVFPTGGAYRGSGRNNRFGFKVSFDGKPLPDIGRKMHFGGLGGIPTVQPGKSMTVQAALDKWVKLDKAGDYDVEVTYDLQVEVPRPPRVTRPWPTYAHLRWQAPRTGRVTVTLKP